MNRSEQPPMDDPFSTVALIERDPAGQGRRALLNWWYYLASPPTPAVTAPLKEREAYRRGKYISNTLLGLMLIHVVLIFVIGGVVNHNLLLNLIPTFLFLCLGVFFNKRGLVLLSGIIVVLVLDVSIMTTFLAFGQITVFLLPLLDILVIPELFAASLLPPRFVFVDMLVHIVYAVCALTFLFPKSPELTTILQNPASLGDALAKPIVIQIITAVVAYTWMKSVTKSAERADRATSLALLERDVARQAQFEAERKSQLESEIQEIVTAHMQVANGNLEACVPLRPGNALLPVAGSLNNLIARFRGLMLESQRLQCTDQAISHFFHARNAAQNGYIPWQPTGTSIDVLVQQHNSFVQQRTTLSGIFQPLQEASEPPPGAPAPLHSTPTRPFWPNSQEQV